MPSQRFSSAKDVLYLKKRDAERFRLLYMPKKFLVHQRDTTPVNIYGEPGEITTSISGTDGVTSASSSRIFTSSSSNFSTAGVRITDILEILNAPADTPTSTQDDNGRYLIETVSTNTLVVDRNWPHGSLNTLNFKIHILKERYTLFDQNVPFLTKLSPTKKELEKWGITEVRDCKVIFSIQVCDELNIVPKIGDRFILPYGIGTRNIQYEIKNLYETDQLSDSGIPFHLEGFAQRVELVIST